MSKAVKFYTEKDDKKVLQVMIQKQIAKNVEALNSLEVDSRDTFEEALEDFKKDKKRAVQEEKEALEILQQPRDNLEEVAQAVPDDDFDMIDDKRTTHVEESDDEMENLAPQSKRGRGRGSRGSRGQSKIFLKLHFESFQVSPTFLMVMDPKSKCNWVF